MSEGVTDPWRQRLAAEHAAAAASRPALGSTARQHALRQFLSREVPDARDENWRYANLRTLDQANFTPPAQIQIQPQAQVQTQARTQAWTAPDAPPLESLLPQALEDHARYVFIDGLFCANLSTGNAQATTSVTVTTGQAPSLDLTLGLADTGTNAGFALLNDAFATDGADIFVPANADARIEIIFLASGSAAAYPRLSVRLGAQARLSLIERHLAPPDASGFIGTAIAVHLDDGATLDHYRLQQAGSGATWIDTLSATVGRHAAYATHALQLGALSARSTAHIRLARPEASACFNAIAVADGRQVLDTLVLVEHQAPGTRTEENFRGIANGRSRLGFNGKIIVRDTARKAESAQSLRGLIAGAGAEINVRPQLEIHTDDVRCAHGATTGKLDENMLFYLLSRGLAPEMAQRLLKWAFLTDVASRITPERLRQQVRRALVGHMQDADALKELL